jgi:adenosylhomocysteinase
MNYDVADLNLADRGVALIEWAERSMPVLRAIRERFAEEKPFDGVRVSACLHITTETANLARTLKAGGADLVMCASNPLSTQDPVAAALVKAYDVPTFAVYGEDNDTYYDHIKSALAHKPNITIDDGADLVTAVLTDRQDLIPNIYASMEETTTGVNRLRAMENDGVLQFPVFAVNDADCKHLFDNRYGTGQSTLDGILRATNSLIAGTDVVVAGYGMCGRGLAMRMKGMGARVTVTEINPLRALEARMDGFQVCTMHEAAVYGDVFVTLTGNKDVLRREHFEKMKDGAIICNSGHFNVEINIEQLTEMSADVVKGVRANVDDYQLKDGRSIYLLGEGRLVNLAAAEGHPACVMDMSFAVQALTSEYALKNRASLGAKVYNVHEEIDAWVAKLKLASMGTEVDVLTDIQKAYMAGWQEGT